MPISTVVLTRTERLKLTVDAPAEWSWEVIKDAILTIADDLDPELPLGMGRVTLRVDKVMIGEAVCDDPDWSPLVLTDADDEDEDDAPDDDLDDDDDDDFDANAEDNDDNVGGI